MERLPDNNILQFNPDTLVAIRRLYNLDKPGQMSEAVNLLDDWLKKQTHLLKKDFSPEYLERTIIFSKGSIERAKIQIDKICTLRTLLPNYFQNIDIRKAVKTAKGYTYGAFLPKMTNDHRRIMVAKINSLRFIYNILCHLYATYTVLACEYLKAHEYNDGFIGIIDIRGINVMDIHRLDLQEIHRISTIMAKGYDMRARGVYILSDLKTIDIFVKLFKQMTSEKMGSQMFVIKEVEDLHKYIAKELLPSDYGGTEKSLSILNDELLEVLGSEEHMKYINEISKARTEESLRMSSKYNDELLGIAGTFRSYNID